MKYQCWAVKIFPFAEKTHDADVNNLYGLPTKFLEYGFDQDNNLQGVIEFEREMSVNEVKQFIPRLNWIPYRTKEEIMEEWTRLKPSLINLGYMYSY